VESKKGEGTRFILTMPLTLAIIDGFRVGVGNEIYVIPVESVRECVELPAGDKEPKSKWGITKLRGKPLPFLYLKRIFELESSPNARENLIVIGYGDKQAGIVVDRLLGEAQTVIKPLGKLFQDITGIAGSTILGNGRVAFVLDVASMVTSAINEAENAASVKIEEQQKQENSSSSIFEG
jgi:two-component system chemotaxis sensor kinase CheA